MALMMLVGTSSAWGATPETLYFTPNSDWKGGGAWFAAYFFGNGDGWVKMTDDDGDGTYSCTPSSGKPSVIFCRMKNTATTTGWGNQWNQTIDESIPTDGKNCYSINNSWGCGDGKGCGSWSTYTPPCNVTLSVSKNPDANIYLTSEPVTLTATATNQNSITWKIGDNTLGTGNSYAYTQSEVGSASIKAIAENTTCSVEKTIDIAFVNQKAIKITTNGNYYLYTWNGDNTDKTKNWPGIKGTLEGNVYVWTIETTKPINVILNKGDGQPQSADIENLQVGYEYYLQWDGKGSASVSTDDKEELPKPCTPPAAPTLDSNSTTVCSETPFDLPNGYRWYTDDKDGTKLASNTISAGVAQKTIYYAEAGEDGCVSTTRTAYTVNVDAKPAITLASPSSICTGTEIDLTEDYVESITGTVTWYSDANRSQEITNGIVTPINTGTLQTTNTYYAKVSNGVCSAKTDVSLSIKVDPQSAITLKAAPTICQGTTITFADYVDTSIGTVTWHTKSDFSDAAITSAKPNATTTYYAKATSGNCTPATASLKVIVDPKPAITLKAPPSICPGNEVTFEDYVNTFTGTVTWHTESDFSDAAITSATPNATTTYYAKATSGVCSTPATASLLVTVKATPTKPAITLTPPDGKIVKGENATLTVTEQYDVTFTLYKDGASTGETGSSFTIKEEGTYHVVGINSCKVSSESDKKTITICTPNATLLSATYNQGTDKIDLSGNLTETCGKNLYYGFLWKVKGEKWNTNNAISGTGGNNNNTSTNNTGFEQSWANAVMGTTYVFTAYALDASSGNPSTYVWYYDETGIEASKCITITEPNITAAPICAGSKAILTLNNKQTGVTYTLLDGIDGTPIFTDDEEYTTPPLADNADYTIIATSGSSCTPGQKVSATVTVQVEQIPAAPAIKTEATICPYTDTPLSNFNNGVANVVWYANDACTQNVTEANITEQTTYYARIEQGTCASPAATLTLSVYPAPEVPTLSFSQKTVGQGKTTILTINEYSDDNTYVVYQSADNKIGSDTEVGKYTAPMNISHANTGTYYYYAIATSKACSNLTTTSNELVALTVVESGVKINYLGSTTLYKNDPTHFVPMYVKLEGVADAGADAVQSFTWQYSADGSTGWTACNNNHANFNATNNKSDKKVVTTNGSEKCNNWRASAVGYYRCLITYDNQETATSNVIQVTDGTNNNTNKQHIGITYNLPIISVNTGSKSFPSDCGLNGYPSKFADDLKAKISVDVKIFNPDGTVCYDRKARMNYRGSSSLNFKKKSYAFVTGKEKTKNDKGDVDTGKANLFGLSNGAEDKDWVLYAATPDPSMMRNRLTFDLYKEMTGKWGVSSMYVELVINGEYKGVYVLMDKVTNNENRVNITSNSGFIVKFDKTDVADRVEKDGDQKTFATTRTGTGVKDRHPNGIDSYGTNIDQRFEIEYPEKEDIVDAGGNWTETYTIIKDRFEEFEAALAEKDYPTVRKLIDYDSWADWFIISEYIKNQDTYRASNIFVFNGDKIEAWPLWDQELSFNNQTRTAHGSTSTTGLMATTSSIYSDAFKAVFWLTGGDADDKGGLLGDPCFVALVKSKWETYKANQLSASNVSTKVTALGNELGKAQEREQAR
jgi:hypothetical protein